MPISLNEFSYTLDLSDELDGVPRAKRKKVKQDIGKLVLEEIEKTTRRGRSPVDDSSYAPLSPEYKKFKKAQGKSGKADLHLKNKMIKSIKSRNVTDGVKFESTTRKELPKLFNHNTGDTVEQRQILPDEQLFEDFSPRIQSKIDKILAKSGKVATRKTDSALIEEAIKRRLGERGAQAILRQGLDLDILVDEILRDLGN